MHNFALIGVAGFVAPRHLDAIRDTGNCLLAAVDPNDSVGILDRYSFDVKFFQEIERFDRFLEKARRGPESGRVHYVSICSPNYLHDAHARLALRVGANVICEKPLVINPWNLDALQELEIESGRRVHTVLQLRLHPSLVALRGTLASAPADPQASSPALAGGGGTPPDQPAGRRRSVELTYVTARGGWYDVSWKGSDERSGGVATNIGIHFFDVLLWLFGGVQRCEVHLREKRRMSGFLELKNADVRWFLSVDASDLPFKMVQGKRMTHRSISVDGSELEFTESFGDLHTAVYRDVLAGGGFGIDDARPSIELVYGIRTAPIAPNPELAHPFLREARAER